MSVVEDRIAELGFELPEPVAPLAAYVPAVRTMSWIYTAGQLPIVDGRLMAVGLVADSPAEEAEDGWVTNADVVDVGVAKQCAQIAAFNAIAAIRTVVDLDQVVRIVKVTGFVAGVDGFRSHPEVVNGASELLGAIWGENGKHARSAVGVSHLPLGSPVEIELIAEVAD